MTVLRVCLIRFSAIGNELVSTWRRFWARKCTIWKVVVPPVMMIDSQSRQDSAAMRGVPVRAIKQLVFAAASLMVGGVVSTCGPIGFVGLVVPHIGRILLGPRHRTLGPFSVLAGGAFLVVCDTVARTVVAPIELPVGIITALVGGPFFLAMLIQGHARQRIRG